MKIIKIILILPVFLLNQCLSDGYIIKKELPKGQVSISRKGEVILSLTKINKKTENQSEALFISWRFTGVKDGKIEFLYEEYFGSLKKNPDISDKKIFSYEEEKLDLGSGELVIYELTEEKIVYTYTVKTK
ncbi:MAG: hypothetical protein OEZ13_07200 [Spirochaetia bacterium]|nr:hypothetical protein [Spirochaetia bacterium]